MTEQPTTPEPPVRPMPRLGHGVHWPAIVADIDRAEQTRRRAAEPEPPSTPSLGAAGSSLGVEAPAVDVTKPGFGIVSIAEARSWGIEPPPAVELLAMADDLNAHGGLDERFVAALLQQVAADNLVAGNARWYPATAVDNPLDDDPIACARRQLSIVDMQPAPVKTTEPITYESIVEALEKVAPLGPTRFDVVKLTQEQIDAITASQPHATPSTAPWHFFGVPVELVETVEESTPYRLANAQRGGIVETLRADWPLLPRWLVEADREFVAHVNDGVDRAAVLAAVKAEAERPAEHQHVWSMTSAVRCVECRRYLRPWWRRTLDRARRRFR